MDDLEFIIIFFWRKSQVFYIYIKKPNWEKKRQADERWTLKNI